MTEAELYKVNNPARLDGGPGRGRLWRTGDRGCRSHCNAGRWAANMLSRPTAAGHNLDDAMCAKILLGVALPPTARAIWLMIAVGAPHGGVFRANGAPAILLVMLLEP